MENSSTQTAANPQNSDQNKQDVLKDIRAKWSQDASAFKGKSDLVSQVAAKYGIDQAQAQREVDAVLKGRQVGAGA